MSDINLIDKPTGNNNLFDEIDSQMFENTLYPIRKIISHKEKFNLLEQLKINKTGLKIFLYQALIFITYNINVNHLYFSFLVSKLGLLIPLLLLIFIGIFCFLFQIVLIKNMEKNEIENLLLMLENHFGNYCSLIFKYFSFGWIALNYINTVLFYIHFVIEFYFDDPKKNNKIYFNENWQFYIINFSIIIFIFFILKVLQNSNSFDFNLFFNLILNLYITFYIGKKIYEGNPINKEKNVDLNNDIIKNNFIKSIYLIPNSFNNLLNLFLVNKNLKLSLYPILNHKKFLLFSHFIVFVFYFLFLFLGKYYDFKEEEDLLMYIIKNGHLKEVLNFIFVIGNLICQILNIHFYLYTMKYVILKSNDKLKLIGFKNFIFTLLFLIIANFIALFCYLNDIFPSKIILINNSTFGIFINFLFPSLFILKYTLSVPIYFILSIIFFMYSICLIHVYDFIRNRL